MQVIATGKTPAWARVLPQLNCFFKNRQAVRVMKLTTIMILAGCLQLSARGLSQTISISVKDAPLLTVLKAIEKQTDFVFIVDNQWLQKTKRVTLTANNVPLQKVLDQCFKDQPLTYNISGKVIVISPKEEKAKAINAVNEETPPIDVKGRVVNENGEPVAATVTVKGTGKGTSTDQNGEFHLTDVDENAVLVITGVGIEEKELKVAGQNNFNVIVRIAIKPLDEVQMIAYGTTTKRFNTGNVSSVKASEIERQPVNNPLLAMEGRVPGLFIVQNSGIPGGGITVRLQGQNSLVRGSDPLYVIDGVPYVSQLLPNIGSTGTSNLLGSTGNTNTTVSPGGGNPLAFINPADIESIEVLKDADATAIYGSRAANGAILITTKKGMAGKTNVGINFQTGYGKLTSKLDLLNTQQYLDMRRQAYYNDSTDDPSIFISPTSATAPDLLYWDQNKYTDWQKVLLGGTARYTDAQISVSGGSANTQFLLSGGYHRETTVFPGDLYDQKGSAHLNINHVSTDQRFRVQVDAKYMVDNNHLSTTDLTNIALRMPPNAPDLYDKSGSLNWEPLPDGSSTWVNPLSFLQKTYLIKTTNLIANSSISYQIIKGLELKADVGYVNLQTNEKAIIPLTSFAPEIRTANLRMGYFTDGNINSWNVEPQLSFKRSIGDGNLQVLVGSTILNSKSSDLVMSGSGYNSDLVIGDILSAPIVTIIKTINSDYKYNALFGRVNYNWKNKYIINVSGRIDGSSRFGIANQFHNFGSIAGAWLFNNESILKKSHFLSYGKLRISYGTTGNDQIGDYQYLSLYSPYNVPTAYQGASGLAPQGLPNPNLQWEETKKLQFGLDLGFIQDRILFNANFYDNRSSNLLQSYSLPIFTGNSSIQQNFPATVKNFGWEFSLNTKNINSKKFTWSTNVNLTIPRNKLLDFPDLASSSYANSYVIGRPVTIRRVFNVIGVDPSTGLFQFLSHNGTIISSGIDQIKDKTLLVNIDPKFYGGFQNSIRYAGFQLDVFFQFVKQISPNYTFGANPGLFNFYFEGSSLSGNQPTYVLNNWQKNGDQGSFQKYSANYPAKVNIPYALASLSNLAYSDGSYIRLKNVSLSWQLPEPVKNKLHLKNARIYLQGQNILTITNFKGLDPESPGVANLPPLRVITAGIQVGL